MLPNLGRVNRQKEIDDSHYCSIKMKLLLFPQSKNMINPQPDDVIAKYQVIEEKLHQISKQIASLLNWPTLGKIRKVLLNCCSTCNLNVYCVPAWLVWNYWIEVGCNTPI